ncbi:MAG: bifunctional (p)ppGpp synthetase/guanosine-3',5'-bis(diphosphate) 3'-pyrophosphohydrolase [Fimbriimonadales bacterium]|jgi:GTP pyrophosphokinase|nr:bifunctional (p)ppGpp synthetase/guanosine-3',5'-bis(diphosphate) 3'-pyrophosphohydrolase [Fimbriimonadales bacterium]
MSSTPFEIPHDWDDPEDLHQVLVKLREHRSNANVKRIRFAYYIAEQAHLGQIRRSGLPYIAHPLEVTAILIDLQMDDETLCAALLHDVVEDTEVSLDFIRETFGDDVAHLIDGVTKLRKADAPSMNNRERKAAETNRAAETLRKMLLAMAKDYRVMVIKLADRLHNMLTLEHMPPEKQIRIAKETLDIYAPLAARLGIWQIKWQLEDLSFKYLHPAEFRDISEKVAKNRRQREEDVQNTIIQIKERLQERDIEFIEVKGRPKHLFSIFNKMIKERVEFQDIFDLIAIRIIVESVTDCYVVLGNIHNMFTPVMSLFYDYIGNPKPNGYQSLHTKVVDSSGQTIEIQIRTKQMHEVAEFGVAAHWTYKEGESASKEVANFSGLRQQLFDWSSDARTSSDFLRSLSTDLFSEQVFVFTPKGEVLDMPLGSTPIDFAFRVHTAVGMKMVGAKVNGTIAPLSRELKNGDVVEILTRKDATPSLDWLEFVQSAHARSKIKAYFRKISRDDDASRGKEAVERELRAMGLEPKAYIGDDKLDKLAKEFDSTENGQDLLAKIGSGLITVQRVVSKLRGATPEVKGERIEVTKTREGKLQVTSSGLKGVLMNRAKCCNPIPGDDIVGYVTRGRGIAIHRQLCPQVQDLASKEPERLTHFHWPSGAGVYSVRLKIISVNRMGLLMEVSTIFGESKTNVSQANIKTSANNTAEIIVTVEVSDTQHLANVMTKIANFSDVISIMRLDGRSR